MQQQDLHELNKFSSPYSLLVVKANGELVRLKCPFKVAVIMPVGVLKINEKLMVTQVQIDIKFTLVYVIRGKAYYYHYFSILVNEVG